MQLLVVEVSVDVDHNVLYVPYTKNPEMMFTYQHEDGFWYFEPDCLEHLEYAFNQHSKIKSVRHAPAHLEKYARCILLI